MTSIKSKIASLFENSFKPLSHKEEERYFLVIAAIFDVLGAALILTHETEYESTAYLLFFASIYALIIAVYAAIEALEDKVRELEGGKQ